MSKFFNRHGPAKTLDYSVDELKAFTADPRAFAAQELKQVLASRRDEVQRLVDQTEQLIAATAALVDSDRYLAAQYRQDIVAPWSKAILAAHQAFHDLVITSMPAIREAGRLVRAGEGRLALAGYGELLATIRAAEAAVATLKKAKPDGVSRVSIHETAFIARRPSQMAEHLLSILLEGQSERASLGQVTVEDVTSRLVVEGVEALELQVRLHDRVVWVWNHPAVVEQAVPAQA